MDQRIFYATGRSKAIEYAARELELRGIAFVDSPCAAVTHLLLPVPCREDVTAVLEKLPKSTVIFGGMLNRPEFSEFRCQDLLTDDSYLAENAQLTAHCTLTLAAQHLPVTLRGCPVLIVGWGRIGKCLAQLLHQLGAEVSVAARKSADRAMVGALGCIPEDTGQLRHILCRYRLIINTVPEPVLSESQLRHCRPDCLMIELASRPGILSETVLKAPGLPGKMVPESSGKLIARTVMRLCSQKEELS